MEIRPFTNNQSKGGGEAFAAVASFVGVEADNAVVERFEVNQPGEVAGGGNMRILLLRGVYRTYVLFASRKR
jgi:hypothetical protein